MSKLVDGLLPLPVYLVMLLCGLGLHAWMKAKRTGVPHRRQAWLWSLLAAWAWIMSAPFASNSLIGWLERPFREAQAVPPPDPDTLIIVLASGEFRPRLDQAGWERVQGGARLWRQTGGRLVMVGGPGTSAQNSLGGLMAQAVIDMGMPAKVVQFKGGGSNTYEDIAAVTPEVLAHRGPVMLVTSALHMTRALATAQRQGWQVQAHPVGHRYIELGQPSRFLPANKGPERMDLALHELIGQWVYRWRGWSS